MKKKVRLECFEFYDTLGIEQHLESMAAKGWLLCDICGLYIYQRIIPQKIKFAVTYFYEASDYNPYPSNEQEVFYSYCEAAGWKLAAENSKMQIFYSTAEKPIPIETDEEIKLNLIHASMKRNLMYWFLLLVILITDIYLIVNKLMNAPLYNLSDINNFIFLLINIWLFITISIDIGHYNSWYQKSLKSVHVGGTCCKVKKRKRPFLSLLIFFLIALGAQSILLLIVLAICFIVLIAGIILSVIISKVLKKHNATYWENISLSSLSILVMLFLLFNPIANTLNRLYEEAKLANSEIVMIPDQLGNMKEWRLIHDELPLTLQDMNVAEEAFYSYEKECQETFMLSYLNATQSTVEAGRMKEILTYEIADIKYDGIYDLCLNHLKRVRLNNGTYWQQVEDSLWQADADAVYRIYHDGQPFQHQYLICWENRLVRIEFNWDVTSEQLKAASDKLRNI